jgi:hypothetical protein
MAKEVDNRYSRLAGDVLSAFSKIQELVWELQVEPQRLASQRFTVLGMELVSEYAGVAARCFESDLRYAALALDRCFYEAVIRTLEWMTDDELARLHWSALVAFASKEEELRAGGDEAKIPPGVRRDRDRYRSESPESFEVRLLKFDDARKVFQRCFRLSDAQLLADKSAHVDRPSLAVHARPLIAEDFYEMTDEGLQFREKSIWLEADSRVLEIVRIVMLLSQEVINAYVLKTSIDELWKRFHILNDERQNI